MAVIMMEWTPIILAVTGLALVATEIWAARTNGRKLSSLSKRGQILYIASSSIAGIALVIGSLYPSIDSVLTCVFSECLS